MLLGTLSYQTDHIGSDGLGDSASHLDWYEGSLGGPEPLSRYVLPRLGVKLPGALTIFLEGRRWALRAKFWWPGFPGEFHRE